jgi:heme o synthase
MAELGIQADISGVRATLVGEPTVGDFLALMKPRVMSLVVLTALTGMVAAPGSIHPVLGFIAILMIAIGAGASGALNMWYDADIDGRMQRTAARPIPRGRVSADDALAFGAFLSVASVLMLGLLVNWTAAFLLGFTIFFYLVVYTIWLKRRTAQNIVIGGAAGAFPPMVGWACMTGDLVSLESGLMFAIIFLWTPPHFWALALYRCRDYANVGVPMLPVVSGPTETRRQIVLYSFAFVPTAIAPYFIGLGGIAYLATSIIMGAMFLKYAFDCKRITEGREGDAAAKKLFLFSILYLFALFGVLLVERIVWRIMA